MNLRALKNKLDKNEKGFTIIEVMIVLAIAGLIILIVFLAVPALQRNSRNTQRREDAARVSGLVAEFQSNSRGALPTAVGTGAGQLNLSTTDFSIIDRANISVAGSAASSLNNINISTGSVCNATGTGIQAGGGSRAYVITFRVETTADSTTGTVQCIN